MRFYGWLAAIFAVLVLSGSAWAQERKSSGYYLEDVTPASYGLLQDCDCDTACDGACDAGCDTACEPACDSCDEPACDGGCGCAAGGGGAGGGGGGAGWCNLGEPFELFGETDNGIRAGGWFQFGYTNYNTSQFNDHPFGVDLHQAWVFAEKVADGSAGFDWGFRVDYVYGTDGPLTQAFGNPPGSWDEGWDAGGFYGHAIPQLYGEVAYNNLSLKVGHFFTIIGYEVVPAPANFFYSHSFTMFNAEPFTHTGALATYSASEDITVYGGWTAGFDTGFDKFGGDIFLGGISATLNDTVTATYAVTAGNIGFGTNASGYGHSIVIDAQLTDNVNYVFQTDYNSYARQLETLGINQYLIHSLNDCLSHGMRLEWWQTEDNNGNKADLYEITYGFNFRPHANVVFRPEIRWDKDNDGVLIQPNHNEQLGFGMDMILTF